MNALVSVRRVGENFSLPHRRRQPNSRSCSLKIEHDLWRARLTHIHRHSPNFIETPTGRHDSGLRYRLLYLDATRDCNQSDCGYDAT